MNDNIIGNGYNQYCENENIQDEIIDKDSKYYGRVIPIRVVIRKLPDSMIVIDKTFQTLCNSGHDGHTRKDRDIGYVGLTQGQYSIEVINSVGQAQLKGIKTEIMLAGGRGK